MNVLNQTIVCDGCEAALEIYLWDNSLEYQTGILRPMVIVCPGGGYRHLSDREAQAIALQFLAMGYHAAVLRYSVAPTRYPVSLHQLAAAVALCREHAAEWFIEPNQICVCGFSAGGNLAAMLGTQWHHPEIAAAFGKTPEEIRPNALILCYAVLLAGHDTHLGSWENLLGEDYASQWLALSPVGCVSEHTPPCFLWHTGEDKLVPVQNSLEFAAALRHSGVPFDLHIYQHGPHGLALANHLTTNGKPNKINDAAAQWIDQAHLWLKQLWTLPY